MEVYYFNSKEFIRSKLIHKDKINKKSVSNYYKEIIYVPLKKENYSLLGNFGLHPIILEDIFDPNNVSRVEITEEYVFLLLKSITKSLKLKQYSFVLFKDKLIVISNNREIFDKVIKRVESNFNNIRSRSLDFLLVQFIDLLVDNFAEVIHELQYKFELNEEKIILKLKKEDLLKLTRLKRTLVNNAKHIWTMKNILNTLTTSNTKLISESSKIYIRALVDDLIMIYTSFENLRDYINNIQDLTLSLINYQMNDVMKTLTVISTIFIPLTFITGIYGMNFRYMPELYWKFGYILVLSIMIVIGFTMLWYFKKKGWL